MIKQQTLLELAEISVERLQQWHNMTPLPYFTSSYLGLQEAVLQLQDQVGTTTRLPSYRMDMCPTGEPLRLASLH